MKQRKIKFRAWRDNKMLSNDELMQPFDSYELGSPSYLCFLLGYPQDAGIMQYTGVKDRNGIEIYEGDILRRSSLEKKRLDGNPPKSFKKKRVMGKRKVVFHEGAFTLMKSKRGCRTPLNGLVVMYYNLEVIGNIYENPELLKSHDRNPPLKSHE